MFKGEKKVFCSAGISHFLLYPNGDVYRCMAEYNAHYKPLFNAHDGWKKMDNPQECFQDKCYAGCDIDWATKWVFESGNKKPLKIKSQSYHLNPVDCKFWAEQELDNPLTNMAHIVWVPTLRCNYDCRYCGCAHCGPHTFRDFPSSFPELDTEQWLKIWEEILKCYEFGAVTLSGGEPLLSKATIPIIQKICNKFAISITTNLSINVFELVRNFRKDNRGRAGIKLVTASLHPTASGFNRDLFLGSVLYLKNNNIPVVVNFVGHPLQLFLADEYKKWCKSHNIPFFLSPWCGTDNDGFIAQYTDKELEYLNKIAPVHRKTDTQTSFFRLDYSLKLQDIDSEIKISRGNEVIIYGELTNTGDCSWDNRDLSSQEAFKVGAKLFSIKQPEKPLGEYRFELPRQQIKPQEKYNFSLHINSSELKEGMYILDIDVVKENAFWFAQKGAKPLQLKLQIVPADYSSKKDYASEILEVILPPEVKSGTILDVPMKIRNCGLKSWFLPDSKEEIKIGCRLFASGQKKEGMALREFRSCPDFVVSPGETFTTTITLDLRGLKKGDYELVFDMVNEHKFWFGEKNAQAVEKLIAIE